VYDLHRLEQAETWEAPAARVLPVSLEPGGGRIYAVASAADFQADAQTIRRERCRNEAQAFDVDHELAQKSGLGLEAVDALHKQYEEKFAAEDYESAEALILRCTNGLQEAMKANREFWAVQQGLEYVRQTLGRLGGEPQPFDGRVSNACKHLRTLFWTGKAREIYPAVERLRAIVEKIEEAASEGSAALSAVTVDEEAWRSIERVVSGTDGTADGF
jgi:hypothetical protein